MHILKSNRQREGGSLLDNSSCFLQNRGIFADSRQQLRLNLLDFMQSQPWVVSLLLAILKCNDDGEEGVANIPHCHQSDNIFWLITPILLASWHIERSAGSDWWSQAFSATRRRLWALAKLAAQSEWSMPRLQRRKTTVQREWGCAILTRLYQISYTGRAMLETNFQLDIAGR